MARSFWLMKSEPNVFSFDDLKQSPKQTTSWDGVRNYQARNFMRDKMRVGDGVLYYHSRIEPMAIVGTAEVVREAYPDDTQFDPKSKYYDPKATPDAPRWFMVDVRYDAAFKNPLTLKALREVPGLEDMVLLNRSRLSVQPVTPAEWKLITRLGQSA